MIVATGTIWAVTAVPATAVDSDLPEYLTKVRASEMWKVADGTGITVAVVDSGVKDSPGLEGRALPGVSFMEPPVSRPDEKYPPHDDFQGHGTTMTAAIVGDGSTGFLARATAHFASLGIRVERVLTDNAWAYSRNTWRQTCRDLGISPRWTRPWRPQTNGKVERFHRTLLEEWAYHRPYASDQERMETFTDWLRWYNYHRPHTGIGGQTPASRGTNLSEQHT